MKKHILLFSLVLIIFFSKQTYASHIMGCDISYTNVGPDSFKVRLSLYRDCAGILPGITENIMVRSTSCSSTITLPVNLLAGYPIEVNQYCASVVSNCSGGTYPGVQQYIYEGYIKLPMRCVDWTFSYTNCCRNAAITTISTPSSASIYIETKLDNIHAPTNNSPVFTTLPVPIVCLNVPYVYNHGILEADGDSTYYSLVPCNNTSSSTFVSYLPPRNALSPISTSSAFSLNHLTGDISFTPNAIQVGVFSIMVNEYRAGVLIGTTQRDIQLSVYSCNNKQPLLDPISNLSGAISTSPYDIEICAGDSMFFNICGIDTVGVDTITMISNFDTISATAHFTAPMPSNTTICGSFSWATSYLDLGYHTFIVKVVDNNCPVKSSITHTYTIHVVNCGVNIQLPNTVSICQTSTDSILLNAIGSSSFYHWSVLSGDSSSLPCDTCNNFNVLPHSTTVYAVSGTSISPSNADTVIVVVNTTSSASMAQSICSGSSYLFNGVYLSMAGTYLDTLINSAGCDSFLILNLTVLPVSSVINQNICVGENYLFNSINLNTSGIYYDTLTNILGCDSIITLNLLVNPTDTIIQNITMVAGDTLYIDSLVITAAGTYYSVFTNIYGCDSIHEYIVTEIVLRTSVTRTGNVLTADQSGATYQWVRCTSTKTPIIGATHQSFTVLSDGVYAVIISIDSFYDTSICIAMTSIGIDEIGSLKDQISIYPNPTSDIIHISFVDNFGYELLDVFGKSLITGTNQKGILHVDLQNYAAGIYLLKMKVKDQELIYRINKTN